MTTVFVYEYVTAIGAKGVSLAPSLLAEGRAMRDAVCADFTAVPGIQVRTLDVEDEAAFRSIAAACDYALIVAPETDGVLEERCRWAIESGTKLLGPSLEAIRLTSDKWALAGHFFKQGIPHPRTWLLENRPDDPRRLVVKPRDGAGSQDTVVSTFASGLTLPQRATGYLAQEFVPGMAASVAFLIGPESRVPLLPCRQHISDDGCLRYLGGSLPLPEDWADRATRCATQAIDSVPGLLGYVGVDLVLADDPANDCVIEINPRLTTSYVGLRRAARFNIAEALLHVVRGERLPNLPWRSDPIHWSPTGQNG